MTATDTTASTLMVAIDISKHRHEVLIGVPGKKRRRRMTILNTLDDFQRLSASFRHMLTHIGMDICPTPRAFKAWSQNFGHSDVATTLNNYGKLTSREQVEEIAKLSIST